MSISINTSDFTKTYKAVIDGVEFEVRPYTASESIALMEAQKDASKRAEAGQKLIAGVFEKFDNPEKAREILGDLPVNTVMDIYNRIISGEGEKAE